MPCQPCTLVTGGSGFIGSRLVDRLYPDFQNMRLAIRGEAESKHTSFQISEIDKNTDWSAILKGVQVVVHLAGLAHVTNLASIETLATFRSVNTEGTLNLARQAARIGVKRFVFLSSIGVNGIRSTLPFKQSDPPAPVENYSISKFEAEIGLRNLAEETGMEVVIIRPPLVYGANAPGNFGKLSRLGARNLPLPLGAIHNKRSLVGLDNLVDLITTCISHPNAANQTFLVSDDHDVSTTELLTFIVKANGKKPRLIPVPICLIAFGAGLIGKSGVIERLCGSLQVDISHTKAMLDWTPPFTVEEGINSCFENGVDLKSAM